MNKYELTKTTHTLLEHSISLISLNFLPKTQIGCSALEKKKLLTGT